MNPRLSLRRARDRELARRLRIQDHLNCLSEDMGEVLAPLDDELAIQTDRPRHPQGWN